MSIYLDNAATTKVSPSVLQSMTPWLSEQFGNPNSLYQLGQQANNALSDVRTSMASHLGCDYKELVFTSGASESIATALFGIARRKKQGHIVTTAIEHSAAKMCCEQLEKEGFRVTYVAPGSNGVVSSEDMIKAMTPETILVNCMMVNNETGAVQPIENIGAACKERSLPFHVDATQAVGHLSLSMTALHYDLLSMSAHKFHGPKGVGCLVVSDSIDLLPLIPGNQEFELRGGTQNLPLIIGMGQAFDEAEESRESTITHLRSLRSYLIKELTDLISNLTILGEEDLTSPHIVNIIVHGVSAELLQVRCDLDGIAIGVGSACTTSKKDPSHVLLAMGISEEDAISSIRISFSKENTKQEIDRLLEQLAFHVGALRHLNIAY